ncbi:isopenicillin N synthase family dioxygenase [Ornithinimicrobium sediminis]|uniref:isopenicillin N synthase family dioxygenase n=1 Tax=Ornithinimicrobium sediminis TaxID=2904603 RepID=UPI001E41167A|nr:2-oxoglutarate and iron-dependent oxygenase domain-containing protein [Ornithinimicrobium sediminis]MCE0486509.1 isopenicillin N synthase family oxygenase [Ornithinimicrobium sediminis]
MTTSTESLPVLSLARASDPATAAQFRTDLRQATHDYGFFYLVDHGIPTALMDDIVAVSRELFALPERDKLSIENTRSPHFRGYTRVGGELTQGQVDWREQIDIGPELPVLPEGPDYGVLQGPNLWPAALPRLRTVVEEWNATLTGVATRLLAEWAESLGQARDVFDATFGEHPATLTKLIRYPGRVEGGTEQGVGWHNDFGVLTLLLVEPGKRGLQVERHGRPLDAPPVEGALIVNIGEMLEWATDGYLKATHHRVLDPEPGTDRVSVPYFHNPALDAVFPKLTLPAELAAQAPGITLDPDNPILGVYGENALKSRVRAHPNVVEAHHPHLLAGVRGR